MSEHIESKGRTVEEAVSEALLQLGARRDEVDIEVIEEGKSGFLGVFGNRPARVIVKRKPGGRSRGGSRGRSNGRRRPGQKSATSQGKEREVARSDSSARGSKGRDKPQRSSSRPAARKAVEPGNRKSTDRTGDRPSARTSDSGQRRGSPPGPRARNERGQPGQESRGRSNHRGRDRGRDRDRHTPDSRKNGVGNVRDPGSRGSDSRRAGMSDFESQAVPVGDEIKAVSLATPMKGAQIQDAPENLEKITSQLLSMAGFPCRCEIKEGEYHQVKIITDDSSAGMLIGRHGSTVDAIEHLVERMASQAAGERVNMNLDVNNYRRRREENLVQRTSELAHKVSTTGKEIHMEPLCARERRIVHLEVVNVPGLRTYTVANNTGKHVVIVTGENDFSRDKNVTGSREGDRAGEVGFPDEGATRSDAPASEISQETASENPPEVAPDEDSNYGGDSNRSDDMVHEDDANRGQDENPDNTFGGRRD